jgi:NhaP-type Na+/H+ or K+/H+ antiporter
MKQVGASKRLGHLIEGESLLNDGSAFVFFLIFLDMVRKLRPCLVLGVPFDVCSWSVLDLSHCTDT